MTRWLCITVVMIAAAGCMAFEPPFERDEWREVVSRRGGSR